MKCVAFILQKKIRQESKKEFQNTTKILSIFSDKIRKCDFDEVYKHSDSNEIKTIVKKIKFIKRKNLCKDTANGNDLLNYHNRLVKADLYFQLFVTAPLLSQKNY